MVRGIIRAIWAIALALVLTACGFVGGKPNTELIEQAIALQLSQTQQELSQQLRLDDQPISIRINRIKIAEQTPLQINQLQSYHLLGICDFTVKFAQRSITQQDAPFEVYLQRQQEGKTWRVASLKSNENGELTWVTQRIPTEQFEA